MQTTLERPERGAAVTASTSTITIVWPRPESWRAKVRVELIEGESVDMAPIGSAHGGRRGLTSLVARVVADGRCWRACRGRCAWIATTSRSPT